MYTIKAKFQRFRDVDLAELIGAIGVYVIWDAHAKARPTYIGEGNILKRFTNHVERYDRTFAHPWDGYVAIIYGSTPQVHKEESRVVERLLLEVAKETDRSPVVNVHPGAATIVRSFCKKKPLRIAVSGYDPLLPPSEAKLLQRPKEIKARATAGEDTNMYKIIKHNWRDRRTRASVIQ